MPDVKPVPDRYPRVSPSLTFDGDGCSAAIDFYTKVLGATERLRMPAPGGKVAHAKLQLGGSVINLSDENPGQGYRGPKAVGGTPVVLNVYVDDVDATFKRAIAAGAKALRPVENVFYGDRIGYFEDPGGTSGASPPTSRTCLPGGTSGTSPPPVGTDLPRSWPRAWSSPWAAEPGAGTRRPARGAHRSTGGWRAPSWGGAVPQRHAVTRSHYRIPIQHRRLSTSPCRERMRFG